MRETQGVGVCDLGIVPGQASEAQTFSKFVKNKMDSLPPALLIERSSGNDADRPLQSPGLGAAVP
jgi:hypothetical protein